MPKPNLKISLALAFGLVEIGFILDGINRKVSHDHDAAMQGELSRINELPSVKPAYDFWKSKDARLTPLSNSLSALNTLAIKQKRGGAQPYNQTVRTNESDIDKAHEDYVQVRDATDKEIRKRYAQMATLAGNSTDKIALRVLSAMVLPIITLVCAAYILRAENPAYMAAAIIASAAAQYGSARMMFQNVVSWSMMTDYAFAWAIAYGAGMLVITRWANLDRPQSRPATMTVTSTHTVTLNDLPRDYEKCIEVMAQLRADNMPTPPVRDVAHEVLRLRSHSRFAQQVKDKYDEIVNNKERQVA